MLLAFRAGVEVLVDAPRGAKPRFYLANAGTGTVFELAERERFLVRHLDGRTGRDELRALWRERFGEELADEVLDALLEQLRADGCLRDVEPRAATLPEAFRDERFVPHVAWRVAGGRRLTRAARRISWIFGTRGAALVAAVAALALLALARQGPEMWRAMELLWGGGILLTAVGGTFLLAHGPRALVSGMACSAAGGRIEAVELRLLYYVLPSVGCRYLDPRWAREPRRAEGPVRAGLAYHVLVWALATLVACLAHPLGRVQAIALSVSAGTAISGLAFVLNPLAGGEATRWLALRWSKPELRRRALAAAGAWLEGRRPAEPLSRRGRLAFVTFGLATFAFTTAVLVAVSLAAAHAFTSAFGGPGLAPTAGVLALLWVRPVRAWRDRLRQGGRTLRESLGALRRGEWTRKHWLVVGGVVLLLLPYPYDTGGPFQLHPLESRQIHCELDGGRIAQVLVREGEWVEAGQPLARLDRREYEKNIAFTRASLDEAEARLTFLQKELAILETPPDIESIRAQEAEARRLKTLLDNYESELQLTTLVSPIAGRVITPRLESLEGRYLKRGDLLAEVQRTDRILVEIFVPEADASQVEVGAAVKVVAWAHPGETFRTKVQGIAPVVAPQEGTQSIIPPNTVRVLAELPNEAQLLRTSLTGFAKIHAGWHPVCWVLTRVVFRWIRVQLWYWIP